MERELKKMLGFLKDGDTKQKQNEEVKALIKEIREATHKAEDLIESYLIRASRFPHSFTSLNSRSNFFQKIDEIKKRIKDISARRSEHGLVNLGTNHYNVELVGRNRECNNVDCDDGVTSIIGFRDEKRAIREQLQSSISQLFVVAIVGIDGLGKTTLASSVYHNAIIKEKFGARAWVSVTENCTVIDVLRKMIKELAEIPKKIKGETLSTRSKRIIQEVKEDHSNLENWREDEIKWALHELIKTKGKCLIVIDDVCRKEIWERIRTAFLTTDNGSRVILTTRSMEIAKSADPYTNPYELRLLDDQESRALFLRKIYPNENLLEFVDELKEVGEELLTICGGLPLYLVLLGGLLSTKVKTFNVWSNVLKTLNSQSNDVLGLCYDELSHGLKPCFLYIGAFEGGSEIRASQLKRLWMAESLVLDKKDNLEREQIANLYLEYLIKRSLFLVTKRKYNGNPSRITIHRLIRDLCIKEGKENNFLNVEEPNLNNISSSSSPTVSTARRLAFHGGISNAYIDPRSLGLMTPSLRTLMYFGSSKLEHRLGQHLDGLKLLTVIDVEGERRLTTIPNEITNLIHLKYLRWIVHSNHGVKSLPSLGSLHNLQTLATNAMIRVEDGLDALKNLRCLTHVKCGMLVAKQIIKLTSLKRLKITFNEKVIFNQFEKQRAIESVSLFGEEGSIQPEAFTVFPSLHKLKVCGKLSDSKPLPAYSLFPQGLTKLALINSRLNKDPMPTLEKLPNLVILSLEDRAYDGKSMVCSPMGFPLLTRLVIKKLEKLEEWKVAFGAMKRLGSLTIEGCRRLKMLPEGLQHINSLKEMKLIQMGNVVIIE
ncbi:hypothetical protein LUZ60_007342 [Juncus effusus]|nr:hypothetical protein LUZ60_007342 [Juncus effusus]